MAVGENKSVADDEACSMSLSLAPDLVATNRTEVYVIGKVELNGR